jgi:hypothetical protein
VKALLSRWPTTDLSRFSPKDWGSTLFALWSPGEDRREWTQAWLGWEAKAYSPGTLARGIEVFEKTDPSAVVPLLTQAYQLYPEDRRFLPLVGRHPEAVRDAAGLLARDFSATGGFGPRALAAWLDRDPGSRTVLTQAGYSRSALDASLGGDYGVWLASKTAGDPADGPWVWDSDGDGKVESRLTFERGALVSWSRESSDGEHWTLSVNRGKPSRVSDFREGATWTLDYEDYPWVRSLDYRWGTQVTRFRFLPLAQALPLGPDARLQGPSSRWPAALAQVWVPLDLRVLAEKAAAVETWSGPTKVRTVYLAQGEVWLSTEDTDQNGTDDTWSYYRSGQLASVYRDPEGRGQATLRELYRKGELAQVQAKSSRGNVPEFVLFPKEGVQLWDPHGDRRPLEHLFVWAGNEQLKALVFSGSAEPWSTMPGWEPRP